MWCWLHEQKAMNKTYIAFIYQSNGYKLKIKRKILFIRAWFQWLEILCMLFSILERLNWWEISPGYAFWNMILKSIVFIYFYI